MDLSLANERSQNRLWRALAALIATNLLLVACSYITIPNPIVPVTLQTLGVCLAGLILGSKKGALIVVLWLAEAAIGLPVLSNGSSGIAAFSGKTAGYLFSFPLVAAIAGQLRAKGLASVFIGIGFAHLVCLTMGSAWLAIVLKTTFATGLNIGFYPLLPGLLVKSAAVAGLIKLRRSWAAHQTVR